MKGDNKRQTDWSKCCLCQEDRKEGLKSPHTNPVKRREDGYSSLATNIPLLHSLNKLPIKLDVSRLDEGGGIENTLRKNCAKYHEYCRLLFSNTNVDRAGKRNSTSADDPEQICHTKMPRKKSTDSNEDKCFLCAETASDEPMRQAMTGKMDKTTRRCAETLSDGRLIADLSSGDATSQELKYHPKCLASLHNRERSYLTAQMHQTRTENPAYPIAYSELVTYISESRIAREGAGRAIFRLKDLVVLYKQRLEQLGVEVPDIHPTRFKEQLLQHIPNLEAYHEGRDVLLAFRTDIGAILKEVSTYSDAIHLAKAAGMIRQDMLKHKSTFDNRFENTNTGDTVPQSLLQFICMIEHGADIKSQIQHGASKTDHTMAELLQYNCYATFQEGTKTHRHALDRETPFAVHLGLSIFAKTRKRQLIEMLHEYGLCISYDRVLEISAQLGEAVVNQYVEDGVVCPPLLRKHLFTTAAVDNIDHNTSSTTAHTSFHGTSISVFQNPRQENMGTEREQVKLTVGGTKVKKVPELPESYTNVRPAYITKNPNPPARPSQSIPAPDSIKLHLNDEYAWLEKVRLTEEVGGATCITWAAHHAEQVRSNAFEVSITSLLPLIRDHAHSVATIKHAMQKIHDTVDFLNPGQIPVVTADQPLYALAKQIQWQWPEFGEAKFIIMFGGLHIEMAALRSLGTLLQDSGWTNCLVEAGVASAGTANSYLSAASVTRTREAHQITACTLHKLMKAAYEERDESVLSFEDWCIKRRSTHPQFHFWSLILDMELAIFTLIRAFREANFDLYRKALAEVIPYFFANNNSNYARWLPIHLRDMTSIEEQHPEVAKEFHSGKFVVHKTGKKFSAMAIDQAHEQNNAVTKGDGGAIGLTEDPVALRRWMVAGPEVSRLVAEYTATTNLPTDNRHHDQTLQAQTTFLQKVANLTTVLLEMGNPFQEESADLLVLDTQEIADPSLAEMIVTHHQKGIDQFQLFMADLQEGDTSSFYKPIKRNCVTFFKHKEVATKSKEKVLKDECQLFSRLFISCQTRQCDLSEFFQHENQSTPASLSDNGLLHTCQKSQLLEILESNINKLDTEPKVDAIIIDGSALVNAIPPRGPKTFGDYVTDDLLPKVKVFCAKCKRVDVVFDVYTKCSLKTEVRSKRGKGIRRRVKSTCKVPTNWGSFLRNEDNKTELFHFVAEKLSETNTTSPIIVTKGEHAICNQMRSTTNLSPCSHEEADSRIFVHAKDATIEGYKSILIKANDTDIIVIAISIFTSLQNLGLQELWITFGQGSKTRWLPVHDMVSAIGSERAIGMPFFHAFTGCDIVSAFRGKGKKSAWQAWNVCDEISETFGKLSQCPTTVDDNDLQNLERFVVIMYDRSSASTSVNEARFDLFARKQRPYNTIPPTQAALRQHAKRAAYQGGIIWGQALIRQPEIPSPADWGWEKKSELWQVVWMTLPPIAASCEQLTRCCCKKDCSQRCKCYRSGLPCTALCACTCQ